MSRWRMAQMVVPLLALAACSDQERLTTPEAIPEGVVVARSTVTPVFVADNPTCSQLGEGFTELKVEPVTGGTYGSGDFQVTLSNVDGSYFDWSATQGVDLVFVKGGPNGLAWWYEPEATSDTGLHAPMNGDRPYGLSHVSFCYDEEHARISITPDGTNEVGDPHTFTVTVKGIVGPASSDEADWFLVQDGHVDVLLTPSYGAVPALDAAASTCDDAGDNLVDGVCTLVFTSPSAGTVVGHATVTNASVGGALLSAATDGLGYDSGDATKVFVDAYIVLSPLDDANGIGDEHLITASVFTDGGTGGGWAAAADGTLVTFSFVGGGFGESFVGGVNTCTTTDGSCAVSVVSGSEGTATIHAATDVTVGGVALHRETDGTGSNSTDASKTWVDGSLSWTKVDGADQLLAGATFEVCLVEKLNTSVYPHVLVDVNPDECLSVTDDSAPDTDPDDGEFLLGDLVLGLYTVRETAAPAGYVMASGDAVTAPAMSVASPDVTILGRFVNYAPDLRIHVTPEYAENPTETNHVLTAFVEADATGQGSWSAKSGAEVTFSIVGGSATFVGGVNTCTTGGDGTCTVTIHGATESSVTLSALASATVSGTPLTAETGEDLPKNGPDVVKVFVNGTLIFQKVDGQLAPLAGATFLVCRTEIWDGDSWVDIPDECVTVLDNSAPDHDLTAGAFRIEDLMYGRYSIFESLAPAGYIAGASTVFVDLLPETGGIGASGTVLDPFVNEWTGEGCTPGYWKNHTDAWPPTGYSPAQAVNSVFTIPGGLSSLGSATLLQALSFQGGRQVRGAAEILLRAAVSALLNASHPGVSYLWGSPSDIITAVNAALASGNRGTMLGLASELDEYNNLGCPLN